MQVRWFSDKIQTGRIAEANNAQAQGAAMSPIPSEKASENLSRLIDEVAESHEPVQILGKGSVAILVAEEDWRSIQETLHLVSIPGMRASILEGMSTPIEECAEDPGW